MWTVLFGNRETIGRGEYALTGLVCAFFLYVAAVVVVLPLQLLAGGLGRTLIRGVLNGGALFILLYCITAFVVATVRRLKDMGQSGWWALLLVIPGISWVVAWLILSLIPGRRDDENEGAPSQSTPGVL